MKLVRMVCFIHIIFAMAFFNNSHIVAADQAPAPTGDVTLAGATKITSDAAPTESANKTTSVAMNTEQQPSENTDLSTEAQKLICYGSVLTFQVNEGEEKLYSHADLRVNKNSDNQLVAATSVSTYNSYWMVRPPHGKELSDVVKPESSDVYMGSPVRNGDVIRLTHIASGKNLTCLTAIKIEDVGGFQVSCTGKDGVGSAEDNWIVIVNNEKKINSKDAELWNFASKAAFFHQASSSNKKLNTLDGKTFVTLTGDLLNAVLPKTADADEKIIVLDRVCAAQNSKQYVAQWKPVAVHPDQFIKILKNFTQLPALVGAEKCLVDNSQAASEFWIMSRERKDITKPGHALYVCGLDGKVKAKLYNLGENKILNAFRDFTLAADGTPYVLGIDGTLLMEDKIDASKSFLIPTDMQFEQIAVDSDKNVWAIDADTKKLYQYSNEVWQDRGSALVIAAGADGTFCRVNLDGIVERFMPKADTFIKISDTPISKIALAKRARIRGIDRRENGTLRLSTLKKRDWKELATQGAIHIFESKDGAVLVDALGRIHTTYKK